MITIARLFGKSPFSPLQNHMKKVSYCIEKLTSLFDSLAKKEKEKIEKIERDLSALRDEADQTKNDIRNHLPKSLFLPMDRTHFLDILSIQNSIANQAEELAFLLSCRPLEPIGDLQPGLEMLYKKNIEVFWQAKKIIAELDELLESSFGGIGAEKVRNLVEQTALQEKEARQWKKNLMKILLSQNPELPASAFYLWEQIIQQIGNIGVLSERLSNRIRMILELK